VKCAAAASMRLYINRTVLFYSSRHAIVGVKQVITYKVTCHVVDSLPVGLLIRCTVNVLQYLLHVM